MSVGVPKVWCTTGPVYSDTGVDITCYVDSVSIQHGRQDADSQPEANSCTVDISAIDLGAASGPLPVVDVGSLLSVNVTVAGSNIARFTGRVTDVTQGWDDAGEHTPDASVMQIVAVGTLAELGRRVVGDKPWPQQLDGARVAAIMQAAGYTLSPVTSDPGTVQILARDVDSQPALDLAQGVASDAGGVVWENRVGALFYADADHRRSTVSALELDACDILITPTWRRTTEALINTVSIGYGIAPEGGEQPRYTADNPASVTQWGTYSISATTQLADADAAVAMGNGLLAGNSQPAWIMSALPVDIKGLSDDDTKALLGLEMHSLINLTGLPTAGGAPTSAYLWVEGWTESFTPGGHDITLTVSTYCRTSPPPRWDDVDPAQTWDDAAGTWDDAICYGPLPNRGRWNDQPATTRWNTIPPAVTWDTYPTR